MHADSTSDAGQACVVCAAPVNRGKPWAKYCSDACRIVAQGATRKRRRAESAAAGGAWCSYCNTELSALLDGHKYCSDACREKSHGRNRASHLKAKFGVSVATYDAMLASQGGCCAICRCECGTGRNLAVDHCHDTGAVRGLLCSNCNRAIGLLRDDPERLRRAIAYLA